MTGGDFTVMGQLLQICSRPVSNAARVRAAAACACLLAASAFAEGAQRPAAPLLAGAGELRDPEARRRVVEELSRADRGRRLETEARARRLGLALRGSLPDGGGWALMGFEGEKPLYYTTLNATAAITAGANRLWAAPYGADGSGATVGVWDEGSARQTHQEFGGRVSSVDGAPVSDHTTHVTGTICASGVVSNATGMARNACVANYDWNNDLAEMAAAGASAAGEPGKIYLSNHSYGIGSGWVRSGDVFFWQGTGTNATALDPTFGKYNTYARDTDALANGLPYYLMFWAAGNDRGYTATYNPVSGVSKVVLYAGGPTNLYDASQHPPCDGVYRGGFDTMSYHALAKNVVSVGSVYDAVVGGVRTVSNAKGSSWSSWGPADDGRIKPDLVAHGYLLYSCKSGGDSAYGTYSGTSQASAGAAGAAQLLASYYHALHTNRWMRASTLKALLLHTADDLGTPGPDYKTGWGLLNVQAAAELLRASRASPGLRGVTEACVATNRPSVTIPFTWDGASPIRATLCWTDPAGAPVAEGDWRQASLVNDLNLSVTAPDRTLFLPWVMPFVGDWSTNAYERAAVTGTNAVDNVEQVLIAAPASAGVYKATVSFRGPLAAGSQPFALLLSGTACSRSTVLSVR